jgi:glycerate 2-kinase
LQEVTREAVAILTEALTAIEVGKAIKRRIRFVDGVISVDQQPIEVSKFRRIVLVALGKASVRMARAVEELMGDAIDRGIVVTDRRAKEHLKSEIIVAGHPLPDSKSLKAAQSIIDLVQSCGSDTLIIFLVSGGGSSLVELPESAGVTLEDLRLVNELLVLSGAHIREINVVRKSLSRIKGGKLGWLARNSYCIKIFISDVNTGDITSLASNPLLPERAVPDESTNILEKYRLMDRIPASVRTLLNDPGKTEPGEVWLDSSPCVLLMENKDAIAALELAAKGRGFIVENASDLVEGAYREMADEHIRRLRSMREAYPGKRVCVISGGEVSCAVTGEGIGGRNQEFVLYSAAQLFEQAVPNFAVVSCGTDGVDGNSSVAGAVADSGLMARARDAGYRPWDFIGSNDSTSFFRKRGGLIVTGPIGNNVRDLRLLLIE